MKERIANFIKQNMMHNAKYALKEDEPLITGGLIDSFSLVELALFLEDEFGTHFDDSELTAANMNTLNQIVANVESKL
jgi:acyl carrier protein